MRMKMNPIGIGACLALILGVAPLTIWAGGSADGNPGLMAQPGLATNNPTCNAEDIIRASPGENGHLAAARLAPPSYPFSVDAVFYRLDNEGLISSCQAGLAHRVELYVSTATVPDANPTPVKTFDVPAQTVTEVGSVVLSITGITDVELQSGEFLYVAISMAQDTTELCIYRCMDDTTPSSNFWSNAVAPPYSWAELSTWGLFGDYDIWAVTSRVFEDGFESGGILEWSSVAP